LHFNSFLTFIFSFAVEKAGSTFARVCQEEFEEMKALIKANEKEL
jgi:hypothetical protein